MPIYTYRCENCGVQFDETQKFSDPLLTKCPECGKKTLQKVYQPVGIVFKGSGFYATDHRSSSGSHRHSDSGKSESSGSDSSGSSSSSSSTGSSGTDTGSSGSGTGSSGSDTTS